MTTNKEHAVILHGICDASIRMQPLADYLEENGYQVLNINYPSTKHNIEELTGIIWQDIEKHIADKNKIHFIGYSMGAIIARSIINKYKPQNLGRVVHLAPPNNGSEVADLLKNFWPYKFLFGPAGQQLGTKNAATLNASLGKVDYELGIIAGDVSYDPISSLIIKEASDGKVSIASTKLEGMKEHIVISASHLFFPYNKEVHRQVLSFLRDGRFKIS